MSSIDQRIVEMQFNNDQFQKGVSQTLSALDSLTKGLNLDSVGANVEKVASKFNIFGAIGFSAIQRLTNTAIDSGARIYNAVMDPILAGGERRSQNFAMAKFQLEGLGVTGENLTKVMDAANYAVDGTAYGLDQAAVAASSFVASQVPIEDLAGSLRGISGVAAMTGAEFSDISQIFTTVAGNGRLFATEMNRIGQRGVNAWAPLAQVLGTTEEGARKLVSEGKVGFKEFALAMDSAFGPQAQKANLLYSGALSNVRSALARIGEPIADGKFEKLRLIFVDLIPVINNIKNALMPVLNVWKEWQIASGRATASVIKGLGETLFSAESLEPGLQGFANAFQSIINIGNKLRDIFVEVWKAAFPKKSSINILTILGQAAEKIAKAFEEADWAFAAFKLGLTAVLNVISVVFSVFSGVGKILFAIIEVLFALGQAVWDLINPFTGVQKSTGKTVASLQDFFDLIKAGIDKYVPVIVGWINKFRDAIVSLRSGGSSGVEWIDKVYETLQKFREAAIEKIPEFFEKLGKAIGDFFAGDLKGAAQAAVDGWGNIKVNVGAWFEGLDAASLWESMISIFERVMKFLEPMTGAIGDMIKATTTGFKDFFSTLGAEDFATLLSSGAIIGGIVGIIKVLREMSGMSQAVKDTLGSIGGMFDNLGSYFQTLQSEIKTNMFLKIAIAIGILAGSIWLLAQIPTDRLLWAAGTLVIALGLIVGAMILLDKFTSEETVAKVGALAGSMVLLSLGVMALAGAAQMFAAINPDRMAQGMIGMALSFALLVGAMLALSKVSSGGKVFAAAMGITVLASALYIMAHAVSIFGNMDPATLEQGLLSIALILGVLGGMAQVLAKAGGNMLKASAGILILGAALYVFAGAIGIFAAMDADTFVNGGLKIMGVLAGIALFAAVIGKVGGSLMGAGLGILALSAALVIMAVAFQMLSALSLEQIVIGLIAMGGAMLILALGAQVMQGTIGGALAMIVLAGAMVVMAYALQMLSGLDFGGVVQGLILLGIALGMFVLAAMVLTGVLPGVAALAVILLAVGVTAVLVAAAILIIVAAIALFGPAATLAAGGLAILGEAVANTVQYAGPMALLGLALLAFGAGALVAGVGALLLGTGLIVLAGGLLLIAAVGPVGAMAMTMMVNAVAALLPHVPALLAMGAGLLVLGAGALVAGAGILVLSVALMAVAIPLLLVAAAAMAIGPAFKKMAKGIEALAPHAGSMLLLAAAFVALTPGVVGVGAGAMLAGPGMMMLAAALLMIIPSGKMAAKALDALGKGVERLAPQAGQIMALSAGLMVMGASLALISASALLSGVGIMATATALMVLQAAISGGVIGSITQLAAIIPMASAAIVAGFAMMAVGITSSSASITTAVIAMMTALVAAMVSAVPRVQGAMRTIVMAIIQGLMTSTSLMAPIGILMTTILLTSLMSSSGRFLTVGMSLMRMFTTGLRSQTPSARAVIVSLIAVINVALALGVPIAMVRGNQTVASFVRGINSGLGSVYVAGTSVGSTFANGVTNSISGLSFAMSGVGYMLGAAIAQGAANGIYNNIGRVTSAAAAMAESVPAEVKKLLEIRSPSRVAYRLLQYFAEGGVNALYDGIAPMSKAAGQLGNSAVDSMGDALDQMREIAKANVDLDVNLTPTIRPVLDLSEVQAGASQLSSILTPDSITPTRTSQSTSAVLQMERERQLANMESGSSNENVTVVKNYNFNQTNNSPKALSSLDIYRKTHNVVAQAARVDETEEKD